MASKKPAVAPEPDVVQLRCEELGLTKDFTPAHAKALLKLQAAKGWKHWQPVAAEVATTA